MTFRPALSATIATSLIFGIAACAPAPSAPAPAPVSTPRPAPAPRPVMPAPAPENWIDNPATPGDWRYIQGAGESRAEFSEPGAEPRFIIRCNIAQRRIGLARAGAAQGAVPMRILTETGERVLTVAPLPGNTPLLANAVPAGDPMLDAIAYSRGRFAVEVPGLQTLYLPSWPEITRVIEDCR